MIKVITKHGSVVDGEVYAIDPLTKCMALKTEAGSYVLISPEQIASIQGDLSKVKTPELSSLGVNIRGIEKREEAAMEKAMKLHEAINHKVSDETQAIYDRISYYFPTKWDNVRIIVLDDFIIDPPNYDSVTTASATASANDDGAGIDRVRQILAGAREKLGL